MMHLRITDEIRERCLREAAHEVHINDRIVTSTPQTLSERGMTMFGSARATPRIRSYLYCDAVDACFYYAGAVPSVVVAVCCLHRRGLCRESRHPHGRRRRT